MRANTNTDVDSIVSRNRHIFRNIIIIIGALFLIGAPVLYRFNNRRLANNDGCGRKASSPVYAKAASLMTPRKLNDLKIYTDEIIKKHGYENDANCIYPVLYYHLSVGDVPGAKIEYEKLKKAYDSTAKLAVVYRNAASNLADITAQMQRLDETQNEIIRNRTFSQ